LFVLALLLSFRSPIAALTEEAISEPFAAGVPVIEASSPDEQGVQSRGLFPSLPPPPKIRSLSASEKNLAKLVFQNTINYDMVKITDTFGAWGKTMDHQHTTDVYD
jgi:hypothetical protein